MDYLRGEVPSGTQIILSTWIKEVAYFLTYSATDQELIFINNPTSGNIVVATVESFGPNAVALRIDNPKNLNSWIGATNVSGVYFANLTSKEGLSYTNNQFQPWAFPLTGITYSFQQAGFTVNWRVTLMESDGTTTNERLVSGIRVVPLDVFPLPGCATTTLTTTEAINNEQMASMNKTVTEYFTTSGDCNDGFFYDYCPTGVNCGSMCKSPCSLASEVCTLDLTNSTYSCVNTNPSGSSSTGAAIALVVLVVIIIIALVWLGLVQISSDDPFYRINI